MGDFVLDWLRRKSTAKKPLDLVNEFLGKFDELDAADGTVAEADAILREARSTVPAEYAGILHDKRESWLKEHKLTCENKALKARVASQPSATKSQVPVIIGCCLVVVLSFSWCVFLGFHLLLSITVSLAVGFVSFVVVQRSIWNREHRESRLCFYSAFLCILAACVEPYGNYQWEFSVETQTPLVTQEEGELTNPLVTHAKGQTKNEAESHLIEFLVTAVTLIVIGAAINRWPISRRKDP